MKKIFTRLAVVLFVFAMFVSPASAVTVVERTVPEASQPDAATVQKAMEEFKGLSRKEKKERFRNVKKLLKDYKAAKKANAEPETNTVLLAILAILLPPLAVYLHEGTINNRFWISLLLTLLFWLPGVIYALFVVLS